VLSILYFIGAANFYKHKLHLVLMANQVGLCETLNDVLEKSPREEEQNLREAKQRAAQKQSAKSANVNYKEDSITRMELCNASCSHQGHQRFQTKALALIVASGNR